MYEGNPNLKPTLFTNFDIAVDFTLGENTTASVEAFYRDITDAIVRRVTDITGGDFDGFERNRDENGPGAKLQGFEFTWDQKFAFLPGILDGFGINANYVFTDSATEYFERPGETLPLTDQARHELTLTLTYKRGPTYAQIEYGFEGAELSNVSDKPEEDRYNQSSSHIDVSFSYELNKSIRLFADIENISNAPRTRRFEGSEARPLRYRFSPRRGKMGIKFKL